MVSGFRGFPEVFQEVLEVFCGFLQSYRDVSRVSEGLMCVKFGPRGFSLAIQEISDDF